MTGMGVKGLTPLLLSTDSSSNHNLTKIQLLTFTHRAGDGCATWDDVRRPVVMVTDDAVAETQHRLSSALRYVRPTYLTQLSKQPKRGTVGGTSKAA